MGEVLSLGKARKAAKRASAKAQAAENRVKFGRTRVDKQRKAAEDARQTQRLNGALLPNNPDDEKPGGGSGAI